MKKQFRVWDKLDKKYSNDNQFNLSMDGTLYYGNAPWGKDADVEFAIGIKDKNEKEIYEGDVVNLLKVNYIGIVAKNKVGDYRCNDYIKVFGNNPIIIGNIHSISDYDYFQYENQKFRRDYEKSVSKKSK